jgi:hypothetical protein
VASGRPCAGAEACGMRAGNIHRGTIGPETVTGKALRVYPTRAPATSGAGIGSRAIERTSAPSRWRLSFARGVAGGAGAPSGAPVLVCGSANPVRTARIGDRKIAATDVYERVGALRDGHRIWREGNRGANANVRVPKKS